MEGGCGIGKSWWLAESRVEGVRDQGTSQKLLSCLGCRRTWSNLSVGTICIRAKVDN